MDPRASWPANLYPLATQEGQAIPLDVVKPQRLVIAAVNDVIPLVATDRMLMVLSLDQPCILKFKEGESGSSLQGAAVIQKDKQVYLAVPYYADQTVEVIQVGATAPSAVFLQFIEVWEGVANSQRLRTSY